MGKPIKVLLVEDSPDDAELAIRELKRAGYEPEYERVDSPSAMRKALEREWDIILSDHEMPRFSAPSALRLLKETGRDIPFIILAGAITVELAGETMREGARDFIPKNRFSLLGPAIERELEEFRTRRANIQAEEALRESESRMRTIFENALDGILVADMETRKFLTGNQMICRMLGYYHDELQGVGVDDIHPPEALPHVLEQFRKQATGEITLAENLPVKRKDGTIFYADINSSPIKLGKRNYMVGFFRDITERKKAEENLRRSREELKASLIGTIKAVARAVEARDPYTAGHQQRVAALAFSIGSEMGLDENLLEGISLGALIHDIGKIHLPAEILTKPSKLTAMEFSLIKSHPEAGADILADIPFPWPIVDIVSQHHEKLDGSGYPQGLKGKDICMKAKIIAVADVVEAMASHRPYRPALGIGAALEEVTAHRGDWYAPEVVDACVTLFTKKGFSFDTTA